MGKITAPVGGSKLGVVAILVVGALVLTLAALAPQAWAIHNQRPLSQTITEINDNPTPPDCIDQCDGPVFMRSMNAPFSATEYGVPVYITENVKWEKDVTNIADLEAAGLVVHTTTVDIVDGDFDPNPALIWEFPLPGYFDVFFDVSKDGVLRDGDGILGPEEPAPDQEIWVGAGICVDICEVGGVTVPAGNVLHLLWFGLPALLALGVGGALIWRYRRA